MQCPSKAQVLRLHEDIVAVSGGSAGLRFSLINNHPFIDGNKRIGHAVMVIFLRLNGLDMEAPMDEQERLILSVAAGEMDRDGFNAWLREHVVSLSE